jgi:hypothetical protein
VGTPLGRVLIGALAVAAAVVLFVVLSGDDDADEPATPTAAATTTTTPEGGGGSGGGNAEQPKPKPEPEVATIVIEGGEPVGGVQELTFAKGDDIRFIVESDVADEIHLHGYDVGQDVAAGGKTEFDVPATLDGVFEVELEHRVVPIAEITVEP